MTASASSVGDGAIAIIGMACRFPGAPSLSAFWNNLCAGIESVRSFERDELKALGVPDAELNHPSLVPAGGVLDGVDRFDAEFFQFIPRHAELLDPQQRLLLECAWEALEQSGHNPERVPGSTGVYLSVARSTYPQGPLRSAVESLVALSGADKDYAAARVSYKLNLCGPSLMVQSASSSSLVAVHVACESLRNGECDVALAGGRLHRLSAGWLRTRRRTDVWRDGHCRAFDAEASGTVPGNGVGVVVLKALADALADGDPIWAVIKGSAVNNDGARKVDFYAPSIEGQRSVIQEALALARVPASSIGYVEAHGTGTALGDPIEIEALRQAFGPNLPAGRCAIGSVKTNLGHLHSAAGIASLIKVALMVHYGRLVPSLHYRRPNPRIEFSQLPFRVSTDSEAWVASDVPRRSGVSSFGFGGTNAHVILEEPPAIRSVASGSEWNLLPLSARTETALDLAAADLAQHLRNHPNLNLADVAYTLQVGRKHFPLRRVVICRDRDEAINLLKVSSESNPLHCPASDFGPGENALHSLARNWIAGEPQDWSALPGAAIRRRVMLPTYPFERRSFWADPFIDHPAVDETSVPHNSALVAERANSFREPEFISSAAIEEVLRSCLTIVLGRSMPSVDSDRTFAEMGIDSIVGPQLIAEINRALGNELSPTELFNSPTIRRFAAHAATFATVAPAMAPAEGQTHSSALSNTTREPDDLAIAVIGMAGRFPGARNLREFWKNLAAGHGLGPTDPAGNVDRFSSQRTVRAMLEESDCFDALFFQIAPARGGADRSSAATVSGVGLACAGGCRI